MRDDQKLQNLYIEMGTEIINEKLHKSRTPFIIFLVIGIVLLLVGLFFIITGLTGLVVALTVIGGVMIVADIAIYCSYRYVWRKKRGPEAVGKKEYDAESKAMARDKKIAHSFMKTRDKCIYYTDDLVSAEVKNVSITRVSSGRSSRDCNLYTFELTYSTGEKKELAVNDAGEVELLNLLMLYKK